MQPPAEANCRDRDEAASFSDALAKRGSIALIGASVRAAAESALRGGFTVTGLDQFGDQDTLAACHQFVPLDVAMTAGEGEPGSEEPGRDWKAVARIAATMPLVPVGGLVVSRQAGLDGIPMFQPWPSQQEAVARVRDLAFLREVTAGSIFRPPPFFPADRRTEKSSGGDTRGRWLRKNLLSCGGLGTRWMSGNEHAGPHDIVQQWVPGRLFGSTFLSNGSDVLLLGSCRSRFTRKGAFPFVYGGSIGPVAASSTVVTTMREFGQRLVAASGLRGLFNVDFILEPAGKLWLLEVNPRWSGSSELIERHLRRRCPSLSLMSLSIDGLDGMAWQAGLKDAATWQSEDPVFDKRVVFARRSIRFDPAGLSELLGPGVSLHDVPATGRLIRQGEPVCTVIGERSPLRAAESNKKGSTRQHRALINRISGARRN